MPFPLRLRPIFTIQIQLFVEKIVSHRIWIGVWDKVNLDQFLYMNINQSISHKYSFANSHELCYLCVLVKKSTRRRNWDVCVTHADALQLQHDTATEWKSTAPALRVHCFCWLLTLLSLSLSSSLRAHTNTHRHKSVRYAVNLAYKGILWICQPDESWSFVIIISAQYWRNTNGDCIAEKQKYMCVCERRCAHQQTKQSNNNINNKNSSK